MDKITILDEAKKLTSEDRNKTYGHPSENFNTTALLWDAYLEQRKLSHARLSEASFFIDAHDVAVMMVLVKIARLANIPGHRDSLVDAAGYLRTAEMLDE